MTVSKIDYDCSDSELEAEARALGTMLKHPEMAAPVMQYLSKQMFSVPFYRAVWALFDADYEGPLNLDQCMWPEMLMMHEDYDNFGGEMCIADLKAAASPQTFVADVLTLNFRMDRLAVELRRRLRPESQH